MKQGRKLNFRIFEDKQFRVSVNVYRASLKKIVFQLMIMIKTKCLKLFKTKKWKNKSTIIKKSFFCQICLGKICYCTATRVLYKLIIVLVLHQWHYCSLQKWPSHNTNKLRFYDELQKKSTPTIKKVEELAFFCNLKVFKGFAFF